MTWGAFHVLELMSSPRFTHKRLACLVGSIVLPKLPELVIMAPCQLKRTFCSKNVFEICSAVQLAASICTKEVGSCIEDDVQRLITNSKPCVRKRACVLARKLAMQNPELREKVARLLMDRLKSDEDTGVLIAAAASALDCAAVCPELFVEAIPALYKLLENKNNWLVIKALQGVSERGDNEPGVAVRTAGGGEETVHEAGGAAAGNTGDNEGAERGAGGAQADREALLQCARADWQDED